MKNYDKVLLAKMWNADEPVEKIAKILGISEDTVKKYARKHPDECKKRRKSKKRKFDEKLLIEMWQNNVSTRKIAQALGVSQATVRTYAREHREVCKAKIKDYDRKKLAFMWNNDEDVSKIADELNISEVTVTSYAKEHPDECKVREIRRKRKKKFDEEKLKQMWEKNISVEKIAKEFGICGNTVRRYAQEHLDERPKTLPQIKVFDEKKLADMWNNNVPISEIAKLLGISQKAVKRYVEDNPELCKPVKDRVRNVKPKYDEKLLIQMYFEKKTIKDIASKLGVSPPTVRKYVREHLCDYDSNKENFFSKAEEIPKSTLMKIVYLFEKGSSIKEISEELVLSEECVNDCIRLMHSIENW